MTILRRTFRILLERHQTLRLCFPTVDGEGMVREIPIYDPLTVTGLSHLPEAQQQTEIQQQLQTHTRRPFDLAEGRLLRLHLLILNSREHVLLFNMHHIISDGWSMGVLVQEWVEIYSALLEGRSPDLDPLPIQYSDYAAWQRDWLQDDVLQRQLGYWTEQLGDAPELLALPTDFPRPAMQNYRGNYLQTRIDSELTKHLNEFARQQSGTLFMVLLAAFDILLSRYSGQNDICVGSSVANRPHPDTENLIGFFINTLVLRTRLNREQGFRKLLQQVRQTCLGAYAHQDIPFETLVEQLNPTRTLRHSPLFQVSLVLQNNVPVEMELPGLTITALEQDYPIAKFDLTLYVSEQNGQLYCVWEYATSLFTEQTIQRMGEHFEVLLRGIVEDPERPVSRLPLLSEAERQRILVEWNATQAPYPQDKCVHKLFEAQVAKTPDAVAVIFEEEEVSYGELNARANRLAHRLRKLGVGPEVLAGLFVERSVEMVVGLLAILKAGGAYVPLDPEYPMERLAFMAEDAALDVLLCHRATRKRVPECAARILDMDTQAKAIAGESPEDPEQLGGPDNLAYVIYTSGSTGRPKGVMVEHENLCHSTLARQTYYEETELEAFLLLSPVGFDSSVAGIFWSLTQGAKLVLPEKQFDVGILAKLITEHRVTHLLCVPLLYSALLSQFDNSISANLRAAIIAGESSSQDLLGQHYVRLPTTKLFNEYGPTEATVWSSVHCFKGAEDQSGCIGRPIPNTEIYILDANLQPLPIGVAGELYVGGAGVARGYLNRPGLTAERFIPDPFSIDTIGGGTGARIYRTGDSCRWLPDGNIEYLGRIDSQVKIRGFRIECGEVENALLSHPDVREAAVDARGEGVDKQLVAWVYAVHDNDADDVGATGRSPVQDGRSPLRDELRTYLRGMLPDWMIPSVFVFLDALPLTPSGKIDRRALPAPEASDSPGTEYVAPLSPTEELLAQLWSVVLKREPIGRFDNFFDLGGHSLLAMQLISRIRDSFQVELPVRAIFEQPELSALAQIIKSSSGLSPQLPPIEPQPADALRPLSFAQQRLWFLDRFETDGTAAYNIPAAVRFEGTLDVDALQSSLQWMVERHESLRMAFPARDGKIGVIVLPAADFEFPVRDLRSLSPAEQQLQQRIDEHATRSFDLARGPLFRVEILQLAKEDGQAEDGQAVHVLLINMHHIISDGWSIGVFVREWQEAYIAFAEGHRPTLAPLPVQYSDYAYWQRQWLQGENLERQSDYWREALFGIPELLELPTDYPRPAELNYQGNHYSQTLPADTTAAIKALSRAQGVTLFMTLLAAFDVLLSRYSGQDDICVGSPIANRTHTHTENLIGFFVNTLVLRTRLNPEQGFRALLEQVRQTCLGAYAHQDIPFETLVEQLNPTRSLSHSPLFQVMLVLQNNAPAEMEWPELTLTGLAQDYPIAKFDLTLNVVERDGQLHCIWEYATSLFTEDTIRRMGEHFEVLLRAIVAEPETSIAQLPLLSEAERRRILVEWNDTKTPYPQDKCVHELFEEQVARFPNAVALVFEDEEVSYGELNARANRLAHRLRKLGIGPEVLVGLFVARSVEMVVGILAILKAGGAYVPLDPEYPAERLAFMAEDADLKVLLCHGATRERVPECAARILDMDTEAASIAGERSENPERLAGPNNLAYVIYTSGSTGKPKGVTVEHSGLANLARAQADAFGVVPEDRVLQFASLNFDASLEQIFSAFLGGAALVLRGPEIWTVEECQRQVRRHKVTLADFSPIYLHQFLESCLLETEDASSSLPIKRLVTGGEVLGVATVTLCQRLGMPLFNAYGPTEATITATNFHVSGSEEITGSTVPIGRPIANVRVYILDRHRQPAPVGVPGELHIGGVGIARGYLNRPELTIERFIPDPFSDDPNARLYRTGDLCRWLPNGTIEFLGRIDTQVKIRGFRIECGEVENSLLSHPDVREAVVDARGEGADKQLVAWLGAAHGNDTDDVAGATDRSHVRDELRTHLRALLPDWMIPARFVFVEELPLTPSGKIDRKALPDPDVSIDGHNYEPPRNANEQQLADIWSAVLKRPDIGIHDNFFDLGGDSILSIQIVSRARQTGLGLRPRDIFGHQTIAELAGVIQPIRQISAEQGLVQGDVPLTPIQSWFFAGDSTEFWHFNQAMLLEVPFDVGESTLERALAVVLEHHDVFRLRYRLVEGEWQQTHAAVGWGEPGEPHSHAGAWERERSTLPFHVETLSGFGDELERRADHWQASLDLEQGPLTRLVLFRTEDDARLLWVIHHLIVDGVSWRILLEDLDSAYAQAKANQTPKLPAKTSSFKLWSERLREWRGSDAFALEANWWRQLPQSEPSLPVDHPGGANRVADTCYHTLTFDPDITRRLLIDSPSAYRTGINDLLLAALLLALRDWTGQREHVIDLESHGRADLFDDVDLSRTVGWFTALYTVALELPEGGDLGEIIKTIKEQLRKVPHDGVSCGLLRQQGEELPQGQILFNYLGQFDQTGQEDGFQFARETRGRSTSLTGSRDHLIDINGMTVHGQLSLTFSYSGRQYADATIQNLAAGYRDHLRALIEHCQNLLPHILTPISEQGKWDSSLLFSLRRRLSSTGKSESPLFCIHPRLGGAFCYRELADCLPDGQPVYGIQAVGSEGSAIPLTDIRTMAARYVREIVTMWPKGPCNLYGWSFGGVVAFEMVRLLEAAGREVPILVLADAVIPTRSENSEESRHEEVMRHLLAETDGSGMSMADSNRFESEEFKRFAGILRANDQALSKYRPSPQLSTWKGKVILLTAKEGVDISEQSGEFIIWEDFVRHVDHYTVPGNHFTMHKHPNVHRIAEILRSVLAGADHVD